MKKKFIYIGTIPAIFGYGISVAESSEKKCYAALKMAYKEWKEAQPDPTTNFKKSFENWGGSVKKVELGKCYYDDFAE